MNTNKIKQDLTKARQSWNDMPMVVKCVLCFLLIVALVSTFS